MAIQSKPLKKQSKPKKQENQELDGVFLIKLALYVVLGSLWLKINRSGSGLTFPIPVGLLVGILFSTHELFRVDRKIEYAVLVCAAVFGFIAPYGLFINL